MKWISGFIIVVLFLSLACNTSLTWIPDPDNTIADSVATNQITRDYVEIPISINGYMNTVITSRWGRLIYDPFADNLVSVWIDWDNVTPKMIIDSQQDLMRYPRERHDMARTAQRQCATKNFEGETVVWPVEYICPSLKDITIYVDPPYDFLGQIDGINIQFYYGEWKTYCIPVGIGCAYREYRFVLNDQGAYAPEYRDRPTDGDAISSRRQAHKLCLESGNAEVRVGVFYDCNSIANTPLDNSTVFYDHGIMVILENGSPKTYYIPNPDDGASHFIEYDRDINGSTQGYDLYWMYDEMPADWLDTSQALEACQDDPTLPEVTIFHTVTYNCASLAQSQ